MADAPKVTGVIGCDHAWIVQSEAPGEIEAAGQGTCRPLHSQSLSPVGTLSDSSSPS
jgi:hypothetical protein